MLGKKPHFSKLSGVTLLELLIAIALLAGLLGISVPFLFRTFEVSINKSARDIAVLTKHLQFSSILQNRPFRMVFDFNEDEAFVEAQSGGQWVRWDAVVPPLKLSDGISFRYFKSGPAIISANQARVNILPFGYVDIFQITLEQGSQRLLFKVNSAIGDSLIEPDENLFF